MKMMNKSTWEEDNFVCNIFSYGPFVVIVFSTSFEGLEQHACFPWIDQFLDKHDPNLSTFYKASLAEEAK